MNHLRGSVLPAPRFHRGPLSPPLLDVNGYRHLQTFFPTLTKVFRLATVNSNDEIWMDTPWRVEGIDCSGTTGPCTLTLRSNSDLSGESIRQSAFLKTTHLLDPVCWIQGEYALPKESGLPWHRKAWQQAWNKLQDTGNQAYVEAVCSYAVGRINQGGLSPHFNAFYGSFCARAETYRYNLSDDFQSYRHERWFWRGYKKGLFQFKVLNTANPGEPVPPEVVAEIIKEYDESDEASEETLDCIDVEDDGDGSIHSAESDDMEFGPRSSPPSGGASATSSVSSDEESDDSPEHSIYAEIPNYPVMLILTEKNDGTMDSLFENPRLTGREPGTPEWEELWTAWTFQVIAALCCAQRLIGLTHNDLHTNNIVWSSTKEEYITYTSQTGSFRVPTFGRIFRIIDFGRAIFTINKHQFISDDFKNENHAAGQYVFSPLVKRFEKEIPPNPSFDLCRFAVSLIEGVFPNKPERRKGGAILSEEKGLVVYETVSPLYNLLWSWMIDDDGRNVFINPDETERFPDFDLYKHIAEFIHKAIPYQQIGHVAFKAFYTEGTGVKGYPLFC